MLNGATAIETVRAKEIEGGNGVYWLDMPSDAEVLLDASTSCTALPISLKGYVALECGMTRNTRACMKLGAMESLFYGRWGRYKL